MLLVRVSQHLMDVSELLVEHGVKIEAGPGKHGVSQAYLLYVIEPGGNRVELFGYTGYQIFDPDWKTVEWKGKDLEHAIIWYGSIRPSLNTTGQSFLFVKVR